ncbi:XRE family transcriptional regulator [Salmonella enterica]|nr:XRE family transcriptional regulator [Salmonella enterica]ECE0739814.1 XRE family transcriptional regulator [Salmonella enterica subsp. enterica serovar Hvittingfoss]HEC8062462.1 helix-turn-helix transcriptional regulator [Salmonella enterica subsp. enterica serovar Potsdam]EGA8119640.1 helix-turn-helix transcriptional regulator [Salmonella enterica]EHO8673558.1 helix-turn-helix transcriptional regulator [Salmonella enterica]
MSSIYSDEYQLVINILRNERIRKGLTQKNFADIVGKPQSFISKVESGERRLDFVEFIHLARLLSLDPCEIILKIP